ncbi:MAG: Rrf2 family transcriptional regulator [Planctomycetes bacterium]|nr:Rrf2 family transcriptional regulator [Planctomycetota bacterium]
MISRASVYAVRSLTFLALQPRGTYHLARDMAERLGIPAPFLAKILQPLVSRGLVDSQRGRSGGFRLALDPAEITLFQIVDAQEHLGKVRQCMLGQAECTDERACPLHTYWKRTSDEYMAILASTSLRDLSHFTEVSEGCGYPIPLALIESARKPATAKPGTKAAGKLPARHKS